MSAGTAPVEAPDIALRRIAVNAVALLGTYVLPRSLTFAAALIAARVLRPAAFGVYGTAAALAMSLSILCTLGMMPLLVREMARDPASADGRAAAADRIKLFGALPMVAIVALTARALALPPDAVLAAVLLATGHVFWALAESAGARLQAEERMGRWLEANVVFGAASAVLAGSAVIMTRSVPWFCAGFAAGQGLALLYLKLRTRSVSAAKVTRDDVKRLARAAAPFALAFLALTVFYKFDVLLLTRLAAPSEVGIYAAGYRLVDVAHALAVVAATAIYPRLSRVGSPAAARRTLELCILAAFPLAALLWLSRTPLVALLFGSDYGGTADVLALLAPATALLALNIVAGYLIAVADRVPMLAAAYGAAVVVKAGCGVLWMPSAGAVGAAAAMLAGESLTTVLLLAGLARARLPLPHPRAVALGLAAVPGAAAASVLGGPVTAVAAWSAGVIVLYAVGGALSGTERQQLRATLRRPRAGLARST